MNLRINLVTGVLLLAAIGLIILSSYAHAVSGTFIAPDGSVTCDLAGVQVINGR